MNTSSQRTMTIQEFCKLYRLKLTKDKCGEEIIPGKLGHLFDHGHGQFEWFWRIVPLAPRGPVCY